MPTPPPSEEAHRDQERERLLTVLRGIAEQETARLHSGRSSWPGWLDLAARHGRHGFTNSLLIDAQLPAATDVRSYQEWQTRGRQVRKGETGIRILSPRGNPRPVFDISQTDGPATDAKHALSSAQAWDRLRRLAADLGFYVDRGERWTYTGPPSRLITIASTLNDLDAVTALAHQLGHVRLHGGRVDPSDGEQWSCHGIRQAEADSTAYLLLAHLGVSPARLAFSPVDSWAGTDQRANPPAAVRAAGDRILRAATQLSDMLDAAPPEAPPQAAPLPSKPSTTPRESADRPASSTVSLEELAAIQLAAHRLYTSLRPGSWVPAYLHERGFPENAQKQWQIGHAPAAWRTLTDHLRRLGHSDQAILASGLARRGRNGRLYDLFRDRAMLAIRHADGTLAGFIGRSLHGAEGPKYLNSPQTPLFRKGELLFGLHEVRGRMAAGARPVLVEGPLDAIAVNLTTLSEYAAVAPSGTALTAAQLDTLARTTDLNSTGLILALDGDPAGRTAIERAWNVLAPITGPIEVALLPQGQDPADLLHHEGRTALRQALQRTVPIAEVLIDAAINRAGRSLQTPEDRMAAARAAAAVIAQLPPGQVAQQVTGVAHRLRVEPAIITNALTSAVTAPASTPSRLAAEDFPLPPLPPTPPATSTGTGPTGPTPRRTLRP